MTEKDYAPSYQVLTKRGAKQAKTLFMAPVFVKRHEAHETDAGHLHVQRPTQNGGDSQHEPTREKPSSARQRLHLPSAMSSAPKESFTQTSKTILQLAQLERTNVQNAKQGAPTPKGRVKLPRENTLDLCPELEQDLTGKVEKIELDDFEDKFSVDSLNIREEPVKETKVPKVTRDLQDFLELKAVTNLRLTQWMNTINKHSAFDTNASSLTDFHAEKSICQCGALLTCKKVIAAEKVQISLSPRSQRAATRMTSFHSFINVHDENHNRAVSAASSKTKLPGDLHSEASRKTGDADPEKADRSRGRRAQVSTSCLAYAHSADCQGQSESHNAPINKVKSRSKSLIDKRSQQDKLNCAKAPFTNSKEDQSLKVAAVREPALKTMRSSSLLDAMSVKHLKKVDNTSGSTFMFPTLSSEKKSLKQQVESVRWLMGSKFSEKTPSPKVGRKKRGQSPAVTKNIARIKPRAVKSEDLSKHGSLERVNVEKLTAALSSSTLFGSNGSCDNGFFLLLNLVKSTDFSASLKGLAEIIDTAKHTSREVMMPYMTLINQRLLQLLKSPRSHVARTACQLTGHFFEVMKDTRRPEFDDIVNTLLFKTADTSKFIRTDANMALDAMVTHIPVFHAVRSLCAKGPTHRNPLVRCAAARLIICAVVIAGPSAVMTYTNLETTRKRIFENLVYFLDDKNVDTRKYAERLYVTLANGGTFDLYAKKYLNPTKYEALIAFGSKL